MRKHVALPGFVRLMFDEANQAKIRQFVKPLATLSSVTSTEGLRLGLDIQMNRPEQARILAVTLASFMEQFIDGKATPGIFLNARGEVAVADQAGARFDYRNPFMAHFAEPILFVGVNMILFGLVSKVLGDDPVTVMAEASTVRPQFERNVNVIEFVLFFLNVCVLAAHGLPMRATLNGRSGTQIKSPGSIKSSVLVGGSPVSGLVDESAPPHARYPLGMPKYRGPIVAHYPTDSLIPDLGILATAVSGPVPGMPPMPVVIIRNNRHRGEYDAFVSKSGRFVSILGKSDTNFEVKDHRAMGLFLETLVPSQLGLKWKDESVRQLLSHRRTLDRYDRTGIYLAIALASLSGRIEIEVNDVIEAFSIISGKPVDFAVERLFKAPKLDDIISEIQGVPMPSLQNGRRGSVPLSEWVKRVRNTSQYDHLPATAFDHVLADIDTDKLVIGMIAGHREQCQRCMNWVVASAILQVYWEKVNAVVGDQADINPLWVPPHVGIFLKGDYSSGKSTALNSLNRYYRFLLDDFRCVVNARPHDYAMARHDDDRVSFVYRVSDSVKVDPQAIPYAIKAAFSIVVTAYTIATLSKVSQINEDNSVLGLSILPVTFCFLIAGMTLGGHWARRIYQLQNGGDFRPVLATPTSSTTEITSNTPKSVLRNGYRFHPNPQFSTHRPPSESIGGLEKTLIIHELGRLHGRDGTVSIDDIVGFLRDHVRDVGPAVERYRALVLAAANTDVPLPQSLSDDLFAFSESFTTPFDVPVDQIDIVSAQLMLLAKRLAGSANKQPTIGDLKKFVTTMLLKKSPESTTYQCEIRRDEIRTWVSGLPAFVSTGDDNV